MKRLMFLFLSLFIAVTFQISSANTGSNNSDPSQQHPFATPEQTWGQFKTAILNGDFDTAKKCCCKGKTKGILKFEKMDAGKRKNIVLSMQKMTRVDQQGNRAKYKLMRSSKGTHFFTYVYFVKKDNEWKIDNY